MCPGRRLWWCVEHPCQGLGESPHPPCWCEDAHGCCLSAWAPGEAGRLHPSPWAMRGICGGAGALWAGGSGPFSDQVDPHVYLPHALRSPLGWDSETCHWIFISHVTESRLPYLHPDTVPTPASCSYHFTKSINSVTLTFFFFISPSTHNTNIYFCIIWKGLRFSPWLGKQAHCNFLTDDRESGSCDDLVPVGCGEQLTHHSGLWQGTLQSECQSHPTRGVRTPSALDFWLNPRADSFSACGSQGVVQQGSEHCPHDTAH